MTTDHTTAAAGIDLDPAALDKLEALARAATPGPWSWWTSNSQLRLTANGGPDGGVLHAYAMRGHADIACSAGDASFIAAANPATVLQLIALARRATSMADTPQTFSQFGNSEHTAAGTGDAHERALFDAWVAPERAALAKRSDPIATYARAQIKTAWEGWKARAALAKQAAAKPVAWIATDLDGRADVAFTKEEAKRRAGEGCTEFIPLHDIAAPISSPIGEQGEMVGASGAGGLTDTQREMQAASLRADLAELQSFVNDLDDGSVSRAFYNVRAEIIAQLHAPAPTAAVAGQDARDAALRCTVSALRDAELSLKKIVREGTQYDAMDVHETLSGIKCAIDAALAATGTAGKEGAA